MSNNREQHTYGLKLRELRENNNLIQKHIADYLNCTQQTYSRYEKGYLYPPIKVLISLSEFYDVSVNYLLGLTNQRNNS